MMVGNDEVSMAVEMNKALKLVIRGRVEEIYAECRKEMEEEIERRMRAELGQIVLGILQEYSVVERNNTLTITVVRKDKGPTL